MQLVRLLRAGEPVKMSKRAGEFVTLREVVDEVGRDAVRFDMLYRKNDAVLDFDLAKVIEASRDNPVFYVQYGHARGESIFRNARAEMPDLPATAEARRQWLAAAPVDRLKDEGELSILRRIALYPRLIEAAAAAHEPHRVAFYLYELASEFHAQWTRGKDLPHLRFIIQNDPQTTAARLALVQGIVTVLSFRARAAGGRGSGGDAIAPPAGWPQDGRMSPQPLDGLPSRTGKPMADDHSQRPYRSSETIARSGQARSTSSAAGSDPLAELARLIGQTDPFGDLGKEPRRAPAAAAAPAGIDWAAPPPQSFAPQQPAPPVVPQYNQPQYDQAQYDNAPFDQAYAQPPAGDLYQVEQDVPAYLTQRGAPAGYEQHGYAPGDEGHDGYDDVPPRRRVGVLAIAGIFALAVLGTAGAFGYRAVFGGIGTRVPPPVIKADTAPSKIVPESAAKDFDQGHHRARQRRRRKDGLARGEAGRHPGQDRHAAVSAGDRCARAGRAGGPALASAGNGIIDTEPKKVHTIVIRPDQPMTADAGSMGAAPPQQPSPIAMPEPQHPAPPPRRRWRRPAAAAAPGREPPQRAAQAAPRAPSRRRPVPRPMRRSRSTPTPRRPPAPRAPTRMASTAPTSLAAVPSANPAAPEAAMPSR